MIGHISISTLTLQNILSYGSDPVQLDLEPLNVLIGTNGSGKSNFLEVLRLLQATPSDLTQPITRGGGIGEWIWKGQRQRPCASIKIEVIDGGNFLMRLDHTLNFNVFEERLKLDAEVIHITSFVSGKSYNAYDYTNGNALINARNPVARLNEPHSARIDIDDNYTQRRIDAQQLKMDQSILAQRSDPDVYPAITYLADLYDGIYHYAEFSFGRDTAARRPQNADLDPTYLYEDASNLALVLNDLQNQPAVMRKIIDRLKVFNPRVENIITRVAYGTVQIYIQETGLEQTIPATRLSDGTLRYLCLLVILCHPTPPPIICIEEPELGMHPDVIRAIAEMLIEASQRTQLIVTTHSDLLVSALSEVPEAIVVCEHVGDSSTLRRLNAEKMKVWLERYSLGELWLKGEIGGTLW